jgi:hypothetical protein
MTWLDMTLQPYPEFWLMQGQTVLFQIHQEQGYWHAHTSPTFHFFPEGKKWRSLEKAQRDIEKKVIDFCKQVLKGE